MTSPLTRPFDLSEFFIGLSRTYGSGSYNESPPIANRATNRQTSSIFGKTSSVGAGTIGTNTSEILLNPSHSFGSTFTSSKNSLRSSKNSLQNPNQEPRTNPEGDSNGTGKCYVIMTSSLRQWVTFYAILSLRKTKILWLLGIIKIVAITWSISSDRYLKRPVIKI